MKTKLVGIVWLVVASFSLPMLTAQAQGTGFTYQGRLNGPAGPANGSYDLKFTLYPASASGTAVAGPLTNAAVTVSNGLFTTTVDFGSAAFYATSNWLEIAVETNGGSGFTTLAPRQPITPTPNALYAENLSGSLTVAQLPAGVITNGGSGAGLATLNASAITSGTLPLAQLPAGVVTNNESSLLTLSNSLRLSNFTLWLRGGGDVNHGLGYFGHGTTFAGLNVDGPALFGYSGGVLGIVQSSTNQTSILNWNQNGFVGIDNPNPASALDVNGTVTAASVTATGTVAAATFTGNAAGLTGLNASAIASGTIPDANLSANVLVGQPALDSSTYATNAVQTVTVGNQPNCVAVADVNGDGKLDLISANYATNTLSVLTNNGSGAFALAQTVTVGTYANWVVAADVNGDGKVDLISANGFSDSSLSVLTNNGAGMFALAQTVPIAGSPVAVVAADVNADGKVDLVAANYFSGTLAVLTNNGIGTFSPAQTISAASLGDPNATLNSVTAADVNGDGHVDLIAANGDNNTLVVLTNNGAGGFTPAQIIPAAGNPAQVVTADVNGDGHVDIVTVVSSSSGNVQVYTNNGAGRFSPADAISTGSDSFSVAAVAGVGGVALIAANYAANTLSVLTNSGSGQFTTAETLSGAYAPSFVTAADLNGDGRVELVDANNLTNTLSLFQLNYGRQLAFTTGVEFENPYNSFAGNGSGLTSLNASALGSGTLPLAQLPAGVVTNFESGVVLGGLSLSNTLSLNNHQLYLRSGSDSSAGLGWFDSSQTFGGFAPQGPVLYGLYGGGLGSTHLGPITALKWDQAGNLYGGAELTLNNGASLALNVSGGIAGNFASPVALIQNTNTSGNTAPALRLVGYGNTTAGVLSVSSQNSGLIAQFGNGTNFVADIQNDGSLDAKVFNTTSDRNTKAGFTPVSPQTVLAKVAALPISEWNFKTDAATRHIGPMAQDFHAAFQVGTDDKHIATVDEDGVALAAIQGLNQKVDAKDAQIEAQAAEIKHLQQTVEQLKQLVQTLAQKQ